MEFDNAEELFMEFKNSFSYGLRTDLNFKFLKNLCSQDAAAFFQELLWKLGDSANDGNIERLSEHVFEWQIRGYASVKNNYTYQDGPFAPIERPISESCMALLTSSGHFVEGHDPEPFGVKHMTQEQAINKIDKFLKTEPKLSHIPIDTPSKKLRVRHGGYDIRGAQTDHNIVLPIQHLKTLHHEGFIGNLAPEAYSFVGAASQIRLNKHAGPTWADMLKKQQVDSVLLVPVWPVCHVSVGHLARIFEKSGISTVIIASRVFRNQLASMMLPRLVTTPHIMGRPLGTPGDRNMQRRYIMTALELFDKAEEAGTIIDL